jgi:hypothetical protein
MDFVQKSVEREIHHCRQKDLASGISPIPFVKIAALHHHVLPVTKDVYLGIEPDTNCLSIDKLSLTYNARHFLDWLTRNDFSAVLHGHQHLPFLVLHQNCMDASHPLLVAGSGSASKAPGHDDESRANGFQALSISAHKGLTLSTFKTAPTTASGPKKGLNFRFEGRYSFPLHNVGRSVSYTLASKLEEMVEAVRTASADVPIKKLDGGKGTMRADFSQLLKSDPYALALKELLIALGILRSDGEACLMDYHDRTELPLYYLKCLSRFLKARGENNFSMFRHEDMSSPHMQHTDLFSPLMFLAHLEAERQRQRQRPGFQFGSVREGQYILLPIFCRSRQGGGDGILRILLRRHGTWGVYLIPASKADNGKDAFKMEYKQLFGGKFRTSYVTGEPVVLPDVGKSEPARPSPSRGELTKHLYDAHFYSLSDQGVSNMVFKGKKWKWFSLNDCENLKHVDIRGNAETELKGDVLTRAQFGKGEGLFSNNLTILGEVFAAAEEYMSNGSIVIPDCSVTVSEPEE